MPGWSLDDAAGAEEVRSSSSVIRCLRDFIAADPAAFGVHTEKGGAVSGDLASTGGSTTMGL
jgi:hypothetical protein